MYLTDAQISQTRTRPHRTRLWLSVFRPRVVLEAQIDDMIAVVKSAREFEVTILSGTMLDVVGGMTVYIGSTQGAKDLGRIRLRSGSGTTLVLPDNAINWEAGWFLTVVRYFEPWGVYPRIILDDDNVPIWYKDWDIAYTDQNEVLDPVVCLGPNDAGMLNLDEIAPTGSHRVWYTSSGTYDPTFGGSMASYGWHFEGGSPTGSTAADPGWVTYTGVGNYVTSLTAVTTGGKGFTGRRHVRVMARPENAGSEKPANAWGLGQLSGERDSGGWSGDIWMREPANPEDIVDGALVVIFSEDYEGGVQVDKIGANAENRGHIFFCGYILDDTITWNPETSKLNFSIGGTSAKLAELYTLNVAVDDHKETEITGQLTHPWSRMPHLTVDRGLVHFLRWQSTVLAVADFSPTADGESRAISGLDIARGNIWESTNQYLQATVGATLVSDRQGKLWSEINTNWVVTGSSRQIFGHMQSVLDVTKQDWRREISITRRGDSELAYLEMSGVGYSGAEVTGSFNAYLSGAPGWAPDYHGAGSRIGNLALDGLGQDGLNQLAGNAWADANALYPSVSMPMAGDYRFIDIAPQERVLVTIELSDTWRQIEMTELPFIPDTISYEYRPSEQMLLMDLELIQETSGGPGETIDIPVEPPYDGWLPPPWDDWVPPIVPPIIDPPIPPPPIPDNIYAYGVIHLNNNNGEALVQTRHLETDPPIWAQLSLAGINPTGTIGGNIGMFRLDPFDPTSIGYVVTAEGVFYSENLNATGSASDVVTFIPTLSLGDMRTLVGEPTAFFASSTTEAFKGTIDVSQGKFGLLAALAYKSVGGSTYEVYFLWSEYCFNGPSSWNFAKLEHDASTVSDEHKVNSGGGPSSIQLAWHPADYGIVYIAGFRHKNATLDTLLWYGDFTIPNFLGDRQIPHTAFENTVHHSIYLPKKREFGAHTLYGFDQRGSPHLRVSRGTNGNDFAILGDEPGIAFDSRAGNETVQERMNAPTEEIYAVGRMQDSSQSAITRYNPETEVFDIVAETTVANRPYYVSSGAFFRGYGYFIWPYDENIQWISDGAFTNKVWETRDGWVTAKEVGGNLFDDFGGGNHALRFMQVCWLQVYAPGGEPLD